MSGNRWRGEGNSKKDWKNYKNETMLARNMILEDSGESECV